MKLFPAKCHERATLRKLWRPTGNSSLLPAKCWSLLHMMAGILARFSNFAFVLFCYITNHLMTGSLGNNEFCVPRISMFPSTSSRETLRFSGNKIHCSPRDQSLSVNYRFLPYGIQKHYDDCIHEDRESIILCLQSPSFLVPRLHRLREAKRAMGTRVNFSLSGLNPLVLLCGFLL